jgi:hypothetical protein
MEPGHLAPTTHKPKKESEASIIKGGQHFNIPVETLPTPPMLEKLPVHEVPANVHEIMADNTVYVNSLNCSGFLIRNRDGEPVGLSTALHCGLLPGNPMRQKDESGHAIIKSQREPSVFRGDSMDEFEPVGDLSQILLGSDTDFSHDETVASLEGHDIQEAINNFQQATPQEISQLKKGDVIYNAGYPVDQPRNPDNPHRQEFAMTVLGSVKGWTSDRGEVLDLLIAAVPKNDQGTECSWGNSGSAAFTVSPDGTPKIIGSASLFNDFGLLYNKDLGRAKAEIDYIQNLFGVDMSDYSAICGFSYTIPSEAENAIVSPVIGPEATVEMPPEDTGKPETPAPLPSPEYDVVGDIEKAKAAFNDPESDKITMDGLAFLPEGKEGKWIKDAYVYPENDGGVVVLHTETKSGEPIASFFSTLDQLELYSDRDDDSLPVHHSTGPVSVGENGEWATNDTPEPYVFGTIVPAPLKPGHRYVMTVDKGGNVGTIPVDRDYSPSGPRG